MKIKRLIKVGLFALSLISINAKAQNALVIIAHGAPSKQWNEPVMQLENQVKEALAKKGIKGFDYVRVALMEFSQPTVASVIKDCEDNNVKHIFAIPLFISPSSHSEQDVPNILGLKYNPVTIAGLKEEGTQLVKCSIPITLGPTLSYGDVIKDIITDRVREMSKGGKDESFVLLGHGDPEYMPFWIDLLKKTGEEISKTTGLAYSGGGLIGMGQTFYKDFLPLAKSAAVGHKNVIVQCIYLSGGIKGTAAYSAKDKTQNKYLKLMPKNVNYVYGEKGLLPDKRIGEWIADRAAEWAKSVNE